MRRSLLLIIGVLVSTEAPAQNPEPFLYVTESYVRFGDVEPGLFSDRTFYVINQGADSLIGSIRVPNDSSAYTLEAGRGSFRLGIGDSLFVMVRFQPTAWGVYYDTIEILHNADNTWSPYQVDTDGYSPNPAASDYYEPNSTAQEAFSIDRSIGTTQARIDPAGDVDYFGVRVPENTLIVAETQRTPGSLLDGRLWLYTENGAELTENDDLNGDRARSRIEWVVADSGLYYVRVAHWQHALDFPTRAMGKSMVTDSTGAYKLWVSTYPSPIPKPAAGAHHFADVPAGESSAWQLDLTNVGGGELTTSFSFAQGSSTAFALAGSTPGDITIGPLQTFGLGIVFVPTQAGYAEAALEIEHDGVEAPSPIRIQLTGIAEAPLNDPYENNNTADSATVISYGSVTSGAAIAPVGDVDYYKFQGQSGDSVTVTTKNLPMSNLDGFIKLTDSSGSELASNDDAGSTDSSHVSVRLNTSGDYFIRMSHYQNVTDFPNGPLSKSSDAVAETGAYVLRLRKNLPPAFFVSENSLDFGEAGIGGFNERDIYVRNKGGGTLNGNVAVTNGASIFSITLGGGAFSIAEQDSMLVRVRFAPMSAGAETGAISITHNASNVATPVVISASGTGAAWTKTEATYTNMRGPLMGRTVFRIEAYSNDSTGFHALATRSGPAQTWDFSHIPFSADTVAMLTYSMFDSSAPFASHPAFADASYFVEGTSTDTTQFSWWYYYKVEDDSHFLVGNVSQYDVDLDGQIDTAFFYLEPPSVEVFLPFELGSTWGDTSRAYREANGLVELLESRRDTIYASGWGKLITPEGIRDCVKIEFLGRRTAPGGTTNFDLIIFMTPTDQSADPRFLAAVIIQDQDGSWATALLTTEQAIPSTRTESAAEIPTENGISALYPNPFTRQLTIQVKIADPGWAMLDAYDVLGRRVSRIWKGHQPAGVHPISWTPDPVLGRGTYFVRLQTDRVDDVRAVVWTR